MRLRYSRNKVSQQPNSKILPKTSNRSPADTLEL
ncbi:hypothetical protein I3843_08G041500 [Carya illinoinensis]|nr:hypothetical protein I3843_08G041500 [Carya illinoinensis]